MSREIKFRCKKDGVWFYATLEEISEHIGFEYGIPENVLAFYTGEHKTLYIELSDKNGKEIFVGDIVREYRGRRIDNSKIITNIYEYWEVKYQNGLLLPFYEVDHCDDGGFDYTVRDVIEIIGNIYENPELLKGDK